MKKMIIAAMAMGLVAGSALAGSSASVDFASAYVFRGQTLNDGFVVQPGIEIDGFGLSEGCGSLALGTWGNFDVDEPSPGAASSEFSEIDWYVSYGLPTLVEGVDLSVGFTEYAYGGSSDKEINLGAGTAVGDVALGASVNVMVGGEYLGQIYASFSAEYAVEVDENIEVGASASVGYIVQGEAQEAGYSAGGAEDGLNDATLGLSATYALNEVWSVGVSGAYIAQLDDEVLVDIDDSTGSGAYDVDFVGMLNLAASF